jgi:hypothetical protein
MFGPIPCTQEQLFPTRWICGRKPSRDEMATHLRSLRARFGTPTARECRSRMLWVGIYPAPNRLFAMDKAYAAKYLGAVTIVH